MDSISKEDHAKLGKNNRKILIIDDEAYIRRVIELKLKKKGYHVITAKNGAEGLSSNNMIAFLF